MNIVEGLNDKLYWRAVKSKFHCYTPSGKGYASLCELVPPIKKDGVLVRRPRAQDRCDLCDGIEMVRRDWKRSGPESKEGE